jgi:hypothetical protein
MILTGHRRDLDPVPVEQPLRELGIGLGQTDGCHLQDEFVWRKRLRVE